MRLVLEEKAGAKRDVGDKVVLGPQMWTERMLQKRCLNFLQMICTTTLPQLSPAISFNVWTRLLLSEFLSPPVYFYQESLQCSSLVSCKKKKEKMFYVKIYCYASGFVWQELKW